MSRTEPCDDDPDPCGLNSGWEGDEYCLKAPAEDEGIQIHFGPERYTEPGEYALEPGSEFNNSVLARIPLSEDKWFNRVTFHARPSMHRWTFINGSRGLSEGFYPDTACGEGSVSEGFGTWLGGGLNRIYDNPPHGIAAPENEGLGQLVPGDSSACLGLHSYNFGDKPLLREVWINLYFVDKAKVTQQAGGIGIVGALGLNLPPGQQRTLTYQGTFMGEGRIIQLFSQRHMWTTRFAAWLNDDLVYDSYDWEAAVRYNYDTITLNPQIDTASKTDGAVSGPIPYKAGDVLKFSCFIDNRSDQTLRFLNEVRGGEMCNLWGSTIGASLASESFQ